MNSQGAPWEWYPAMESQGGAWESSAFPRAGPGIFLHFPGRPLETIAFPRVVLEVNGNVGDKFPAEQKH